MHKLFSAVVLVPLLIAAGYIGYLWATYIDEKVTSGAAYGFTIGASKETTLGSARAFYKYPQAVIFVSYGARAGDNFTVKPSATEFERLKTHEQWDVLLDGNDKFFNSVRLTFRDGKLAEIYRHRKHFELP